MKIIYIITINNILYKRLLSFKNEVIVKHQMFQCPHLCSGNFTHSKIFIECLLHARHLPTQWTASVNIREKSSVFMEILL